MTQSAAESAPFAGFGATFQRSSGTGRCSHTQSSGTGRCSQTKFRYPARLCAHKLTELPNMRTDKGQHPRDLWIRLLHYTAACQYTVQNVGIVEAGTTEELTQTSVGIRTDLSERGCDGQGARDPCRHPSKFTGRAKPSSPFA